MLVYLFIYYVELVFDLFGYKIDWWFVIYFGIVFGFWLNLLMCLFVDLIVESVFVDF